MQVVVTPSRGLSSEDVQNALMADSEVSAIVAAGVATIPRISSALTGPIIVKDVSKPTIEGDEKDAVASVTVTLDNIEIKVLEEDPALKAAFLKGVQENIAKQAGFGVQPDDVRVKVTLGRDGSLVITSVVIPPRGILPSSLRAKFYS
jgi:hypothetical protein